MISMDEKTKSIINLVLKHEGGYVNNINDPGGETNFGISKRAYPTLDIKNLTKDDAIQIYYADYYLSMNVDKIPIRFQAIVLDSFVLHGERGGTKILQRAINSFFGRDILDVDGIMGNKTISALYSIANIAGMINSIVDERIRFVKGLVANNAKLSVFLKGWIKRFESFRLEV